MDWLTFIDHVIRSLLGWPLAVVVSVILLRKHLANIILQLRNLAVKAGPVELTVEREIAQIAEEVVRPKHPQAIDSVSDGHLSAPALHQPDPNPSLVARLKELEQEASRAPAAAKLRWSFLRTT